MNDLPAVYRRHLAAATGTTQDLAEVWEPDGVLEFPYAPSGATARLEGVPALTEYFAGLTGWTDWRFADPDVRRFDDEFLVEMRGSADTGDGGRYEQHYVVRFGVSRRGRIAWMREFWDPTRLG